MKRYGLRHIPIIDDQSRPVGIIARNRVRWCILSRRQRRTPKTSPCRPLPPPVTPSPDESAAKRPLQDPVKLPTSNADIASAKERERERILQQAPQRKSVIVALYPDDSHEIRQHPHGRR
jgi:hypothetical protein